MSNLEKFKKDLDLLINKGEILAKKIVNNFDGFKKEYESWYSEAENLVKVVLSNRHADFVSYYENKKQDGIKKQINFLPKTYIHGNLDWDFVDTGYWKEPSHSDYAKELFEKQLAILQSVKRRFESSLFDIEQLLQADLFENEIEIARELNRKGFIRAAGAIAGVVLEGHLKQVCKNHSISIPEKKSTINPIIDELLKDILDSNQKKHIKYLAGIRNKCDHKDIKLGDPTKEEVEELINGTNKVIHNIF
jgi:hypothetical protein